VSGYVRLIIRSLQKPLQCVAPPGDAFLRQSTSIIAEQVDRFFVRNCFVTAQSQDSCSLICDRLVEVQRYSPRPAP
jgi:hypothetical protein